MGMRIPIAANIGYEACPAQQRHIAPGAHILLTAGRAPNNATIILDAGQPIFSGRPTNFGDYNLLGKFTHCQDC